MLDRQLHILGSRVPQPSRQLLLPLELGQSLPEDLLLLIAEASIVEAESGRLLGIILLLHFFLIFDE